MNDKISVKVRYVYGNNEYLSTFVQITLKCNHLNAPYGHLLFLCYIQHYSAICSNDLIGACSTL